MRNVSTNVPDDVYAALLMRARDEPMSSVIRKIIDAAVSKEEIAAAREIAAPMLVTEEQRLAAAVARKEARLVRTQERRERRVRLRALAKETLAEADAKRRAMKIPALPMSPPVTPPIAPLPAAPTTTPESPFLAPPQPEPKDEPRKEWDPWS